MNSKASSQGKPFSASRMNATVVASLLLASTMTLFAQAVRPPSVSELVLRRTHPSSLPAKKLHPVKLPDGRLLISCSDTAYMLDPSGKQLWKYSTPGGETLTGEPAFNAEINEVGIVANDLIFVRLDASSGTLKWHSETSGRGEFAQVAAYERGFLVVSDLSGYRENENAKGARRQAADKLEYWGPSDEISWYTDFPIGAELVVNRGEIYSLRWHAGEARLRHLWPDAAHRSP